MSIYTVPIPVPLPVLRWMPPLDNIRASTTCDELLLWIYQSWPPHHHGPPRPTSRGTYYGHVSGAVSVSG